ncbi:YIP1 family protein [Paenibacillus sp. GCM10027629]|uniref:YIP1 family protein n=1 Tax=Paenibacillus sp. GCM10027629 TaxID=3273414 RepID=UPI00363A4538
MKRLWKLFFTMLILTLPFGSVVSSAPYYGYQYTSYGEAAPAPLPYLPDTVIYGKATGAGEFKSPEDLFVGPDGAVYVADTGNNRIVVINEQWKQTRIIDSFMNNGSKETFNQPRGVFVNGLNHVYVADTNNNRVVILDEQGKLIRIVNAPEADVVREDFKFIPTKLASDRAGRLFVISQGIYDGIVEYDANGVFTGFTGRNDVKFNAADLLWKRLATDVQRQQMALFIPIEFNNLDIDKDGFIYATTSENSFKTKMVKRLNPSGIDVLREDSDFPVIGDYRSARAGSIQGSSTFVSISVYENGIYAALDAKRGRVFVYDDDGNPLFQFGQVGDKLGNFRAPVKVEWVDKNVLVLDQALNRITVFTPTRYGNLLLDASSAYQEGRDKDAAQLWMEVSKLNNNLELAHVGIGKAQLEAGDSEAAIESFKTGMSFPYYSRAFGMYRKEFMWENFAYIFIGVVLFIAAALFARKRLPRLTAEDGGPIRLAFRTCIRPFSMFWELKYEKKGRVWVALGIVAGVAFMNVMRAFYSGFLIYGDSDQYMNSLQEAAVIIIPFFVWCIANWSLTTLMDGEGTFKDIVIATGYAMLPLLVVSVIQLVFSWFITQEEIAFYLMFESIATLWFIGLLFVGTMTAHQYTPLKTVITMLLTIVVIGIIIFLALLFFSLVQQLVIFATTVYRELSLR